jgi:hypothetical protein
LLRPAIGVSRQRRADRDNLVLDQHECVANLQDRRGVGDVLRGRTPMAPFAEPVAAFLHELLHHRQNRIADALGLLLQELEIVVPGRAVAANLFRGLFWDDPELRLSAGERRLDVEIALNAALIGKHRPHRRRAEDVAKDR